jgi:UMF1 family MFS transporter
MQRTTSAVSTRRERVAWYLYDFANSAYASVVLLAVFSAYFQKEVVGGAEGTRLWGIAVFIAMLFVAITAPVLGAIADFSAGKKRFLFFYTAMSCLFTASLFFAEKGTVVIAMLFFILAEIGYRSAQVFYDALLPEIASQDEMGRVAGTGWAIGSAGGIVVLLVILPLILLIKGNLVIRFSFVITAIFFALFSVPLFLWVRERAQPQLLPPGENYLTMALGQLRKTISATHRFREFIKFMLAFLIYNDGVIMALDFAAILGGVLFGLNQEELIILMILVQAANVIGAYIFGVMVDRIGAKRTLNISIAMMIVIVLVLYFAQTKTDYFIIASLAGFAMAGVQSVSRTLVALLAPPGQSAEFYGFFAMVGRTSSFIGPAVFGWLAAEATLWFQAQGQAAALAEQAGHRIAILSIVAFLVVGLVLLWFVNETRAREAAR